MSIWWDWFTYTTRCKLCCCSVVYTIAHDITHFLHLFERLVAVFIARMSAHPPVWAQGKVHGPWALFCKTTEHVHVICVFYTSNTIGHYGVNFHLPSCTNSNLSSQTVFLPTTFTYWLAQAHPNEYMIHVCTEIGSVDGKDIACVFLHQIKHF